MKLNGGVSWCRSIEASAAKFGYYDGRGEFCYIERQRRKGTAPFSDSKSLDTDSVKNLNASNIVDFEYAELPVDRNELVIKTHFDILDNWRDLKGCTQYEVREQLNSFANAYAERFGFKEFSRAFAQTILSLMWTWRNYESCRIGREIIVEFENESFSFKLGAAGYYYTLEEIGGDPQYKENIEKVVEFIDRCLLGEADIPRIHVQAKFDFGGGREVYPSQLFPIEDENRKQLYTARDSKGRQFVCLTREKVLNAVHTIDSWYSEDEDAEPVNVNSAGYDRGHSICCRSRKNKNDIYSILERFEYHLNSLKRVGEPTNDQKFLMAMILRGCLITDQKDKR